MKTIATLLEGKGYEVWSISPDAPIFDALRLMAEHNVGALMVIDSGNLMGVISERDYARKVIILGRSSKDTPVKAIMSTRIYFANPTQTVDECLALMNTKHIRHLPVFDHDQLIGVISIGDLVKAVIADQKDLIKRLERHILDHTRIY